MATFQIDGTTIHYQILGKGQPLILVAGLASDIQSWVSVKRLLSAHYQIIMIDNRGTGRSITDPSTISIEQMSTDIIGLMDHLQIVKAHLLGHSMGAMIAMQLALDHPQRIDKLILAATTPVLNARQSLQLKDWSALQEFNVEPDWWFRNLFYWLYSDAFFEQKDLVNAYLIGALNYPYPVSKEVFNAQVDTILNFDKSSDLDRIKASTLVIYAGQDKLFAATDARHLLDSIPHAQHTTLSDTGHACFIETAAPAADAVISFLSR